MADGPPPAPTTQEATKAYTFHGLSVAYPESWRLRERGADRAATIYKPVGEAGVTAMWDIDRRADPGARPAAAIRDDVAALLAKKMKGFELREKDSTTVDGKPAAFITFAYSASGTPVVERQIFVPTGDGHVFIISELAVTRAWENESARLERMTRSVKFAQ